MSSTSQIDSSSLIVFPSIFFFQIENSSFCFCFFQMNQQNNLFEKKQIHQNLKSPKMSFLQISEKLFFFSDISHPDINQHQKSLWSLGFFDLPSLQIPSTHVLFPLLVFLFLLNYLLKNENISSVSHLNRFWFQSQFLAKSNLGIYSIQFAPTLLHSAKEVNTSK